jgi:hypothetical protein
LFYLAEAAAREWKSVPRLTFYTIRLSLHHDRAAGADFTWPPEVAWNADNWKELIERSHGSLYSRGTEAYTMEKA